MSGPCASLLVKVLFPLPFPGTAIGEKERKLMWNTQQAMISTNTDPHIYVRICVWYYLEYTRARIG